MWRFTSWVHQRSASQTSRQLSTFIVKHRKLGHMWHAAQCKTPKTGQHWSMLNLREFLSAPSAVWQTQRSRTNAVKKLHHPPCAWVWCGFSLQPRTLCCERAGEPRTCCFCYVGIWNCHSVLIQLWLLPFFLFWPFLTSFHGHLSRPSDPRFWGWKSFSRVL